MLAVFTTRLFEYMYVFHRVVTTIHSTMSMEHAHVHVHRLIGRCCYRYTVNEMDNTVSAFAYNFTTGGTRHLLSLPSVPLEWLEERRCAASPPSTTFLRHPPIHVA